MSRYREPEKDVRAQIEEYRSGLLPDERVYPELTKALGEDLRIIRDMRELEHTCYIEVCPANKKAKACWNKGALYFTVEGFKYLEPMIKEIDPHYSRYTFQSLSREEWYAVLKKFRALSHALRSASHKDDLGLYVTELFYYRKHNPFDVVFDFMSLKLKALLDEVADALEEELKDNDEIFILGL